jgi:hypothetical protein
MLATPRPLFDAERRALLTQASERSILYLAEVNARPVACSAEAMEHLATLHESLPEGSTDPIEVLRILDQVGSPATIATAGGRYFGLVTGRALPVTVAANWLALPGVRRAGTFTLTAARHALLAKAGWNVEEQGLFGAPPINRHSRRNGHERNDHW